MNISWVVYVGGFQFAPPSSEENYDVLGRINNVVNSNKKEITHSSSFATQTIHIHFNLCYIFPPKHVVQIEIKCKD